MVGRFTHLRLPDSTLDRLVSSLDRASSSFVRLVTVFEFILFTLSNVV